MFNLGLLLDSITFCCTIIFALFHFANKLKLKSENINPIEWRENMRDAKLDQILNNKSFTKGKERSIINKAVNKHLLIPYCGMISLISFILFIVIFYLEIKHIL